jgi:DNA-binding NtrC family response regulator
MEQTIIQIQDYLTDNELDLALKKLRSVFSISNSELVNDVILLAGQFKKLKSDVRKGIIDYAQESLKHNRIMNSVLSLIDELKNEPEKFEEFDKAENQLDESIKDKGKKELPLWIKDALFERIAYVKEKEIKIKAIWVDDIPQNNLYESQVLSSVGLEIDFAKSSEEASQLLTKGDYEIMLSDISRYGKHDEGLRFHKELVEKGIDLPTIFYTGYVDREKGVPPFAFGIADMPNDLIHLILDIIERKY